MAVGVVAAERDSAFCGDRLARCERIPCCCEDGFAGCRGLIEASFEVRRREEMEVRCETEEEER